jgi:hypothetical protein
MEARRSGVRHRGGWWPLRIAAAAGLLHAAVSLYWALGGRWQLESVGDWAVQLADDHPVGAGLGLALVALAKGVTAVFPLMNERRKTRYYRWIRILGWSGGIVLVAWGGLSTISAWAVLTGVITPTGGYDLATMIGHGLVWDPLFTVWGGALLIGLWLSRTRSHVKRDQAARSPR